MSDKETFQDNTYSLLKGMHHINRSKEYFEDCMRSSRGGVKALLSGYVDKCRVILDNIRHRLNPELLKEIDNDLSDSLTIESINENLVKMNNEQRRIVEKITELMAKGEEIKIVDETVNTY
jgi:DNA-binding protein YbaB